MNDASSQMTDSTGNNNNATEQAGNEAGYQSTGKIGYAYEFDHVDDYFRTANNPSNMPEAGTNEWLVTEVWTSLDDVNLANSGEYSGVFGYYDGSDGWWQLFEIDSSNDNEFIIRTQGDNNHGYNHDASAVDTWEYFTTKWQGAQDYYAYKNGGNKLTVSTTDDSSVSNAGLNIGKGKTYLCDGHLDEIRISNVDRSDD